jgi:hypothetical protein
MYVYRHTHVICGCKCTLLPKLEGLKPFRRRSVQTSSVSEALSVLQYQTYTLAALTIVPPEPKKGGYMQRLNQLR